jgi:hypothetical protein
VVGLKISSCETLAAVSSELFEVVVMLEGGKGRTWN